MKAALQVDVGDYEIRDVPIPTIAPDQVLIKVGACTLCGTDVKYFKGVYTFDWPHAMGHEVAGVIEAVGSAVEQFAAGDRVVSRMAWGGLAEYVASDADLLMRLPDEIGFEEGAIAQLLPIAVRGAELSDVPGKTVFVSGLGGAGLLCVQTARAYGASKIIASDLFELRRSTALRVGADIAVDPAVDDVVGRIQAETGEGVDVAIDAVGILSSFRACERAVRPGGIVSVFGSHVEPVELDMKHWERRSLQLHMMAEPRHEKPAIARKAADLLADGRIQLRPLLSKVMRLDEVMTAFELIIHEPDRYIKVALVP